MKIVFLCDLRTVQKVRIVFNLYIGLMYEQFNDIICEDITFRIVFFYIIWAASSKNEPLNMRKKYAFRSSCACAEYILWGFALQSFILWYQILKADIEAPDQTARMRLLIWASSVRICLKVRSLAIAWPILSGFLCSIR